MALNFPSAPIEGQVFEGEGATFVWVGGQWVVIDATNFPWATSAQAIAGVLGGLAISPATYKAAKDARNFGTTPLSGAPQDVSGSRALETNYQNDTGGPLWIAIVMNPVSAFGQMDLFVGETSPASMLIGRHSATQTARRGTLMACIPVDWYYRAAQSSTGGIVVEGWVEYRG